MSFNINKTGTELVNDLKIIAENQNEIGILNNELTALKNLEVFQYQAINPITDEADDTTDTWINLPSGSYYISPSPEGAGHPEDAGYTMILHNRIGSDITQIGITMPQGILYTRAGNHGGWCGDSSITGKEAWHKWKEDKAAEDLLVTPSILSQGNFMGTTSIITDSAGYAGFTGTGTLSSVTSSSYIGWQYSVDLTNYSVLSFEHTKLVNHGQVTILIDNTCVEQIRYGLLDTSAHTYLLDISGYTGYHLVTFHCGYIDSTGNASSKSQYNHIQFLV